MNKLILIILVAVMGCSYNHGKEIKQDAVNAFVKGQTTEKQVIAALGKPQMTTITVTGDKLLSYVHGNLSLSATSYIPVVGLFTNKATSKSSLLTITIDKSGIVSNWTSTNSETEVNAGLLD